MAVKVTGQFVPAGDFAIVDGSDVSGNITGSDISASGAITAGSLNLGVDVGDIHRMTGSLSLSGSLRVHGQTIMDSLDTGSYSLVVSGAMSLANQQVGNMVQSASIIVSGLGTIGHRDLTPVIDLGEGFTN
jgi:hypothetical protein